MTTGRDGEHANSAEKGQIEVQTRNLLAEATLLNTAPPQDESKLTKSRILGART